MSTTHVASRAHNNNRTLGPVGAALLLRLSRAGRTVFKVEEASDMLGLSHHATGERLRCLADHGWLKRLARGLYLIVPLEAGPEGVWTEDPAVIAHWLVIPSYLSFWSALNFHHLTEQVPGSVTVATRRPHPPVEVLGLRYKFTALAERKFFGFEPTWVGHHQVPVATPEKAILDGLDHPEHSGGVSEVAKCLASLRSKLDSKRLLVYLARMQQGAVAKRLGFLLELLEMGHDLLPDIRRHVTAGYSLLDPSLGRRGPYLSCWRLRLNVTADVILSGIGT